MATNSGLVYPEGTPAKDREADMFQASHYELVASALAVKIGHAINPDFEIGNMINFTPFYAISLSRKTSSLPTRLTICGTGGPMCR